MDKKTNWWQAHKPSRRRLVQIYAALLYNAQLKGFIKGEIYTGPAKNLCVPGLNCYSCPGAVGACPLGALQNALASSGVRTPAYVLGILLLFGLILGRTVCGWLCPFGLVQELLHKLPTPKLNKSRFTRCLSYLKYVLLAVFVVILPLWYAVEQVPVPAFCKFICPAGTLEGALPLLAHPANEGLRSMLGALFANKLIILILVLAACVFAYRGFCRFLCPLGAIYGLFAKYALLGVKVEHTGCVDCGKCIRECPMDIRRVGDHECIHCGKCISACPTQAIHWKGGRIQLHANEASVQPKQADRTKPSRNQNLLHAGILLLLIGLLVWVNWPDAEPPIPVGSEIGYMAGDFEAPLYGTDDTFVLKEHRGQVTVINFWATWCGPCVKELPCFQRLYEQYPGQVAVVAIHGDLITEDVQAWLDQQSYTLPFAQDTDGSIIRSFGGSNVLPMTVVLDQHGVIVYNSVGSVNDDLLADVILPLLTNE